MHVNEDFVLRADLPALQHTFAGTIAKVQGLPDVQQSSSAFNPYALDRWQGSIESAEQVFRDRLTAGEYCAGVLAEGRDDAFLLLRRHWSDILEEYDEDKPVKVLLRFNSDLAALLLARGLKQMSDGRPLVLVQYLCLTRDNLGPGCSLDSPEMLQNAMHLHASAVELLLLKEVLVSNAARLSTEYKQRCKQEWGIDKGPFDVSFIVPTSILQAQQAEDTKAGCANSSCDQLASAKCSRCQVKYCSRDCQLREGFQDAGLDWDEYGKASLSAVMREHAAKLQRAQHHPKKFWPPNAHGAKRFIVYVIQEDREHFDSSDGKRCLLLYDRKRCFRMQLYPGHAGFDRILALLKRFQGGHAAAQIHADQQSTVYLGHYEDEHHLLPMWLWAKRISDSTVRVYLNVLPAYLKDSTE
ncbi:hypothetical protein WJX73_008645 [Symbiochloris irregularis]|uniref:MYND-type domain-containing protein n=1 Tax=Symbiochloris irregularis TaxID=706552 RepID=A0AAW1PSH2_9CHLO